MKIDVQDSFGKVVESIKLDSNIFNIEIKSLCCQASGFIRAFKPASRYS